MSEALELENALLEHKKRFLIGVSGDTRFDYMRDDFTAGWGAASAHDHQQLAEAQAVTVERCAAELDVIESQLELIIAADPRCFPAATEEVQWIADFQEYAKSALEALKRLRALSPDPKFLAYERLKARLEELKKHANQWLPGRSLQLGDLGFYAERIAELERELAALEEGKHAKAVE